MTYDALLSAPIGIFDSGIGGLSVLKALRAQMPHESFVYFADSAHNPYGDKSDAFIIARSLSIAQQLIQDHAIKALVVACNTATAAAIGVLRDKYPSLPIIGVEPALKPAIAISKTRRIAVLATRSTLQSAKFSALKASLDNLAEFICTPCDGLADAIECESNNQIDNSGSAATTQKLIANYLINTSGKHQFGQQDGNIDTLVLGCTHYPLVLPEFRKQLSSGVHIVDNGQAVARRVVQMLGSAQRLSAQRVGAPSADSLALGHIALHSSASSAHLHAAAARWL